MIRCELLVAAEGASIDKQTNNLSVFNMLEEVTPSNYPGLFPALVMVCSFSRDTADADFDLEITASLDGDVLMQETTRMPFADQLKARLVARIQGLPMPKPGTLTFTARIRGEEVGNYKIQFLPAKPGLAVIVGNHQA